MTFEQRFEQWVQLQKVEGERWFLERNRMNKKLRVLTALPWHGIVRNLAKLRLEVYSGESSTGKRLNSNEIDKIKREKT